MPRYFFHSADGTRNWDEAGVELADDQTARVEAIRLTGAILKDEPAVLQHGRDFRVEVTDVRKRLLFTIITLAVDAPVPGASSESAGA